MATPSCCRDSVIRSCAECRSRSRSCRSSARCRARSRRTAWCAWTDRSDSPGRYAHLSDIKEIVENLLGWDQAIILHAVDAFAVTLHIDAQGAKKNLQIISGDDAGPVEVAQDRRVIGLGEGGSLGIGRNLRAFRRILRGCRKQPNQRGAAEHCERRQPVE